MSFEAIVDNTQRKSNYHNSSPYANGSGELKIQPALFYALTSVLGGGGQGGGAGLRG